MPNTARIPQLDGLRGLAILFVLMFHFLWLPHHIGVPSTPGGVFEEWIRALAFSGWIGVELFFVLSGYLITGILCAERAESHRVRNFYARRGLRIFPLFYLVLALWFGFSYWRPQLAGGGEPKFGWWAASYLSNLRIARSGWEALPLALGHVWTLAIEEQFYLAWPLVIWFTPRRAAGWCCLVGIFGAPLLRACLWQNGEVVAGQTFTLARVDALMWGATLALRGRPLDRRIARLGASVSGLIVAYIFIAERGLRGESWSVQCFGVSALALGFTAGLGLSVGGTRSWLNARWLGTLGRYSYGLYLWHQPVCWLAFVSGLWGALKPAGLDTSFTLQVIYNFSLPFGLTLALSVASWRLWERPFLHLKRHFGSRP